MKKNRFYFLLCCVVLFTGCNSLKQPQEIAKPLDYTDEDVVQNEIKQIDKLLEENSVSALWRSTFLKDEALTDRCISKIESELETAIEQKDYNNANRLYRSLKAVEYSDPDSKFKTSLDELKPEDINIKQENNREFYPKTIEDCINTTVTVWVDKGLKVENGAGYTDIILGSAFFIDKKGYLVTNHHVIKDLVDPKYEGYSRLYIKFTSDMETKIPAKVIGYDAVLDLALLKVELEPEFIFELGTSTGLSVGDKIQAIGSPVGLEGTLTSGIVSSSTRKLTSIGNVFQIDAAVNSGNSGGPLIDENYRVQAIVFAGMPQFQGLNFAIPVEYLRQELDLLYNGGEVTHSWLGAYGRTRKEKNNKTGVEVQYTMPGGVANRSGLKENDLIVEVDGEPVTCLEDFQLVLMKFMPKTIISIKVKNEDTEENKLVYLAARPKYPLEKVYKSDFIEDSFFPIFGMKMVHASTTHRRSYKVVQVRPGSYADENGFSVNDPVTVNDVKFDYENGYFMAQVYVERRKKGFLNTTMVLGSQLDTPNYF